MFEKYDKVANVVLSLEILSPPQGLFGKTHTQWSSKQIIFAVL